MRKRAVSVTRPTTVARISQRRGREHARAADAVAAGRGTEQHRQVARTIGSRQDQPFLREDAEAEDVHEWVAAIRVVKDGLAADRRDADGIAVAGNAGDDAL